uniref:Small COPII coat GTPase SAR1 n=1 Tax=Paramoeba aestuarina TaxID=180227 RepID=A0A7S4NGR5_9EUKA
MTNDNGWFGWFWDLLWNLGLHEKDAKILLLGLDNAGKTTLLHMLKDDRLACHTPTTHPNMERLNLNSIRFAAWDMGGHETARVVWRDYFPDVDCIVYLVDAVDKDRLKDSKKELDALLSEDALNGVPFVVLGNKIDLPGACSEDELRYHLGLQHTTGKGGNVPSEIRPLEVFMCSIVRKSGYGDGFRWISQFI